LNIIAAWATIARLSNAAPTLNDEWHYAAHNYALTIIAEIGTPQER
jgi:hypothetical protein